MDQLKQYLKQLDAISVNFKRLPPDIKHLQSDADIAVEYSNKMISLIKSEHNNENASDIYGFAVDLKNHIEKFANKVTLQSYKKKIQEYESMLESLIKDLV